MIPTFILCRALEFLGDPGGLGPRGTYKLSFSVKRAKKTGRTEVYQTRAFDIAREQFGIETDLRRAIAHADITRLTPQASGNSFAGQDNRLNNITVDGSSLNNAFNENHIVAVSQAVCDHRRAAGVTGPLYIGIDTHALAEPALVSALLGLLLGKTLVTMMLLMPLSVLLTLVMYCSFYPTYTAVFDRPEQP